MIPINFKARLSAIYHTEKEPGRYSNSGLSSLQYFA